MTYTNLLADARANPVGADYQALRLAYARSSAYNPYANDTKNVQKLRDALPAQKWPAALKAIDALLAANYLDIEAHIAADYVHVRREDTDQAAYHRTFAKGLIDSIFQSGDGRDYQTAFIVISISEEYSALRMMGLTPGRQTLSEHAGHWFDVMDVRHPASGAMQVYFNIDIPNGWLARKMGAK